MKNIDKNQSLPLGRLVAAFVLATLANESLHFHQTHNPHGNRTERYAEMRARCIENRQQDRTTLRKMNSGGSDPNPRPADIRTETLGRRRTVVLNIGGLSLRA